MSDPDRFVEMYRRRWGIETAFRCYEQVRLRTTSRNESVRLLLLFFPMLLSITPGYWRATCSAGTEDPSPGSP